MKRYFVLSLLCLALAGCQRQTYTQKLGLPALPAPEQIGAMEEIPAAQLPQVDVLDNAVKNAETPAAAEAVEKQAQGAAALINNMTQFMANSTDTPEMAENRKKFVAEVKSGLAFRERAATIKKAQLQDGDKSDATGEVAENLAHAKQALANQSHYYKLLPAMPNPLAR